MRDPLVVTVQVRHVASLQGAIGHTHQGPLKSRRITATPLYSLQVIVLTSRESMTASFRATLPHSPPMCTTEHRKNASFAIL